MKHIMFEYVTDQKQINFPKLKFDHTLNLSTYKGKIFINTVNTNLCTVTKTFSERESDDEDFVTCKDSVALSITKTKISKEADDDYIDCKYIQNSICLLTKTDTIRESDDE